MDSNSISTELISVLADNGRCIAVMWAYLDESGTHKGSSLIKVAGYVGNEREWRYFQNKWVKKLNKFNIDYFHAKSPKCDILKPHLAKEIIKRNIFGVISVINPEDYNTYAGNQFKSTLGNAYAICAYMCAVQIDSMSKDNGWGPVSYVIEAGQPNVDFVRKILDSLIGDDRFNVGGVMTVNKKSFIPLQTADFLSHIYATSKQDDKQWLDYLIKYGDIKCIIIPNDGIERISETISKMYSRQRYLKRKAKRGRQ